MSKNKQLDDLFQQFKKDYKEIVESLQSKIERLELELEELNR